jgi:hypothetical protein
MGQGQPISKSLILHRDSTALAALAHPLALACAGALLLNALVLQRLWPSWWTGKIGDVAWLVIVPLLVAVPLDAIGRLRRPSPRAFAGLLCLPVALAFAAAKALPAANSALLAVGTSLGLALKLRLDPSDLLALPAVLGAAWVWGHPWRGPHIAPHRLLQGAALGLAALAVLADSGAPTDRGIDYLTTDGVALFAMHEIYMPGDMGSTTTKTIYRSGDGGLSWQVDSKTDTKELGWTKNDRWPIPDPGNGAAQRQLFYALGQGVYHSTDEGQTLQLEQPFKDLEDYEVDAANHTLIVAAGTDGIWVRSATGQWTQTLNLKAP